jgi:Fur family transcriptional regulator, zinc uptake regulator
MNLELYLDLIKKKGYKCTPQRLKILSYFVGQKNRFVSAKSVIKHLRNNFGNVSFDTVYRNLYLFKDIGIIELTSYNGENLYHLKNEINTHEHKFICTECGKTTALNLCPMEIMGNALNDYLISNHKFEVYGLCPSCL